MCGMEHLLQLTDLPRDDVVFEHIFPRLSLADLCRVRGVSRGFLDLFSDYMHTCERLDLSGCNLSSQLFLKITANCENLRWLSVAGCSWSCDTSLVPLFKRNSKLLHVDLSNCNSLTGAALQNLVVNCKRLQTLLLADCYWLSLGCWQVIMLHLTQLQHINVAGCWDVNDQTLEQFFHKFTKLREVHLSKVESVKDTSLRSLAINCPNLESLNIAGCWKVTDQGLKKIVDHCQKLKVLNVQDCKRVTDQYLCSLCVRGIRVISDYSLSDMVKRRKQINHLGINVQI